MTPQAERLVQQYRQSSVDRDGDTIMTDSDTSPPSPSKDKFNFDWFDFRSEKSFLTKSQAFSSPLSTSAGLRTQPTSKSCRDKLLVGQAPQAFRVVYPPPPNKPLTWVWQCHMCRSRYPLSVTRRCLIDGHYYCSGDSSNQRNAKRRRKAQSCTSEFDYVGWQEWGQWMRKCMALRALEDEMTQNPSVQGCQGCSFPSQCRYENRPRTETIDLQKFVKDSDLIWEDNELSDDGLQDDIGLLASVSSYSSSLNKTSGQGTRSNKLRKERKGHSMKLDTRSNEDASQTRRQRFYSSFSDLGRLSSPESSPTSETRNASSTSTSTNTDRGKFDPTLPSVTHPSNRIVSEALTLAPSSKAKYALQPQPQILLPASLQAKKHRTNSKHDNPAFNTTPLLLSPPLPSAPSPNTDAPSLLLTSSPLTPITSRRNLPTFLRTLAEPSSPAPLSPSPSPAAANAAAKPSLFLRPDNNTTRIMAVSDTEVASFLHHLDTNTHKDTAAAVSPILQGADFEDIALSSPISPKEQTSRRTSTGTGAGTSTSAGNRVLIRECL